MKKARIYVDKKCYESLLDFMNIQEAIDSKGDFMDLDLFYRDKWLLDSAVIDNICERNGNWDVYLIFAHVSDPLKLIKRKITRCITQKKAELTANYMRRLAAKDQRGTLKIESSTFQSYDN